MIKGFYKLIAMLTFALLVLKSMRTSLAWLPQSRTIPLDQRPRKFVLEKEYPPSLSLPLPYPVYYNRNSENILPQKIVLKMPQNVPWSKQPWLLQWLHVETKCYLVKMDLHEFGLCTSLLLIDKMISLMLKWNIVLS